MLNDVKLLGRLAQAPELRSTTRGTSVTSFDLAVKKKRKDAEVPDYFTIVCWDKLAEFVCKYLDKGRQIVVSGELTTRKWTDNEGKNRKAVEITANEIYFADSKTPEGEAAQKAENYEEYGALDDPDLPY